MYAAPPPPSPHPPQKKYKLIQEKKKTKKKNNNREMSRAPVNNYFFRIRLFSSKMITGGYTVYILKIASDTLVLQFLNA